MDFMSNTWLVVIGGIARAAIAAAGGALIGKGLVTPESWDAIVGGVTVAGVGGWTIWSNYVKAQAAKVAEKVEISAPAATAKAVQEVKAGK